MTISNYLNYTPIVDIDWEYPDNQAANFVALLQDIYNLLNPRGYLVTIAVGVDNSWAPYRYDIANIARYVHFVNLVNFYFNTLNLISWLKILDDLRLPWKLGEYNRH